MFHLLLKDSHKLW